jgi:hypothetical protein
MRAFPNARVRECVEETKRDQQADCGPKEQKTMLVICKRNPNQYLWRFDHTVLEDIA